MPSNKKTKLFSLCLFAGTNTGNNPEYVNEARNLGCMLGEIDCTLVFGGGTTGIMGAVAHEAIKQGVGVTSVIPRTMVSRNDTLDKTHGATKVIVCGNMHQRKEYMYNLADGFIILPGGIGTMDEFIEVLTWKNLNLHRKTIILVNTDGYWDGLLATLQTMNQAGFLFNDVMKMFHVVDNSAAAIELVKKASHLFMENTHYKLSQDTENLNGLSSLNLACAIQSRAALEGFDWKSPKCAFKKIKEEFLELEDEFAEDEINIHKVAEELGDMFFASINLTRHLGLDHNQVLEQAVEKFARRYAKMQELTGVQDKSGSVNLDDMLQNWKTAKELVG